jgi:hypothetical protein
MEEHLIHVIENKDDIFFSGLVKKWSTLLCHLPCLLIGNIWFLKLIIIRNFNSLLYLEYIHHKTMCINDII